MYPIPYSLHATHRAVQQEFPYFHGYWTSATSRTFGLQYFPQSHETLGGGRTLQ